MNGNILGGNYSHIHCVFPILQCELSIVNSKVIKLKPNTEIGRKVLTKWLVWGNIHSKRKQNRVQIQTSYILKQIQIQIGIQIQSGPVFRSEAIYIQRKTKPSTYKPNYQNKYRYKYKYKYKLDLSEPIYIQRENKTEYKYKPALKTNPQIHV